MPEQEAEEFDRDEWERHIEERAYHRYEHRIKQLQHEVEYFRRCYEVLVKQLIEIEILKPPKPIIISLNKSDVEK